MTGDRMSSGVREFVEVAEANAHNGLCVVHAVCVGTRGISPTHGIFTSTSIRPVSCPAINVGPSMEK